MRQIYLDLFSGVAGDMLVGGLLDAGAPREVLEQVLASILEGEFQFRCEKEKRHGIAGTRFTVDGREGHVHRHLADVVAILERAELSARARSWAVTAFERIAEVEARCHDTTPERVHFHEVGAVDAIVDIAAACSLMDALDPQSIWASAVAVGSGFVDCAHGRMPVPAPGTQELLLGMPIQGEQLVGERATPTGVALLQAWQVGFGTRPPAVARHIGYGVGGRDPEDVPNLLRVVIEEAQGESETVCELRCLVDDQSGEVIGAALQSLHDAGAIEAFALPAWAKKGRPAFEVCVLCDNLRQAEFESALFRLLGTLGMRTQGIARTRRPRRVEGRDTPLGPLDYKLREDAEGTIALKPEFAALVQLARELGLTPREALQRLEAEPDSER